MRLLHCNWNVTESVTRRVTVVHQKGKPICLASASVISEKSSAPVSGLVTRSHAMQETLQAHQQDFMQEDAQAGMIYAFLEDYTGDRVCSKQLYAEALGNTNIPAEWETRAICEIMNTGISRGDIQGWQAHKTAKRYPKYGVQKGWERVTSPL